jgi:phosphohistidine swiveling domain-containing protein
MFLKKLAGAGALAVAVLFGGTPATQAATIDLGFILDFSGSVADTDFANARDALATALGSIPTSGANEYRVAVTRFSSSSTTIIPPTIVTAANIVSLQNTLRASSSATTGGTNLAGAITAMASLFSSTTGGFGDTTLINITTDGVPDSQSLAESAALAANTAGVDGISFEAVGGGVSSSSALANMARIAGLGTAGVASNGVVVSDLSAIPNATTTGFVIPVSSFAAYEAAITAKIGQIVDDTGGGTTDPSVVPLPAGLPLMLGVIGAFALVRRRQMAA